MIKIKLATCRRANQLIETRTQTAETLHFIDVLIEMGVDSG